ncbi:MAG: ABC transporter ATP-binding protein, partial [Verrucomicrobiaceae bacterium]
MKRFYPYFAYLAQVKGTYLAGIAAGLIFAAASGFGMPMLVKKVFPVIFSSSTQIEEVRAIVAESRSPEEADEILERAFPGQLDNLKSTAEIREWFVERVGPEKARDTMLFCACALIPIVALFRGIAGFFNTYWIIASGLHVLREIQQSVFVKLQKLPLGFFSGRKTGDLISRVITDSNMLQGVVTTISNDLIKQPFTLLFALCFLGYTSWQSKESFFLLLCLLSIPIAVLPIRLLGKRLMRKAAAMQREAGDNSAILAETLGATREI